ncbi:MAG: helix-turn-helix domain-containing protein [Gammaproteobacteria bacterium]|nr:helix-turn-helix domain-containing protein [Gammaproteobacteria bacterium]MDP2140568.1 helix-turn-helix domain-containing protein [Gammaproteobacteria bacterium]MDP2347337.1 helix-turn-helix domain-containing protein [Gammaproteobacteria bacterium]
MDSKVECITIRRSSLQTAGCTTCQKRTQCPANELMASGNATVRAIPRTFRGNETVVKAGQRFDGLYMVRSGFFKSTFVGRNGDVQVTGFHFPGEIFGMEGIEADCYGDTTIALDSSSLCRIPLALFTAETSSTPSNTVSTTSILTLVKLMSAVIGRQRSSIFDLGKMDAKRHLAAFLLDVSERMGKCGYQRDAFRLCMSRIDIANHLNLVLETVSRLFTQFVTEGYLAVSGREVRILNRAALTRLAEGNPEGRLLQKAG